MTSIAIDRLDGLSSSTAIKGPCRVATTANITLSGEQTIDGVSVVADDRVLVKNQTTTAENGIYVAATGSWRRASDFESVRDIKKGSLVHITDGTTNANTTWAVSSASPSIIGTDSISFSSNVISDGDITPFILTLLDDADAATARTTLGAMGQSELHDADDLVTSDSPYDPTGGGNGWFTDYDCKSPRVIKLEQSTDNTGTAESGVIRSALSIQHADEDTSDYETAVVRSIANGVRVVANGAYTGSGFSEQFKDIVGVDAHAIGRIGWDDRGVSGVAAGAIQYGTGIASNEFAVENPAAANEQSVSMAAVQAIVRPYKAAADGSHIYRGLYVENDGGYRATHGIQLASVDAGGSLDGSFEFGLYLYGSDVNSAAISMPRVGAGRGIIEYDSNYYSNYNAGSSRFDWVTNGNIRFSVGDDGIAAGAAVAGTSRLEVAAGTASIAQMNMAASATLSSPSNGDFWFDGANLKIQIGGSTYNVDVTAA